MITQFCCWYCDPPRWINKDALSDHMFEHKRMGEDIGIISAPMSWEEYIRRFGAVGLIDTREVEDE